jgi:hypothetical protein
MTDLEDRLHDLFQTHGDFESEADWDDVVARLRHRTRRRTAVAAAATATVVAATAVGVSAIVRDRGSARVTTADSTPERVEGSVTFDRTATDGEQLHVTVGAVKPAVYWPPWMTPATACATSRTIGLGTPPAVWNFSLRGPGGAGPLSQTDATVLPAGGIGHNNQVTETQYVAVELAGALVRKAAVVRATLASGETDEMAPRDSFVFLALRSTHAARSFRGPIHVDVLDAQGASLFSKDLVAFVDPNCPPVTPALPAPGSSQPSDVALSTADVRHAYETAYDGAGPAATRDALIDDTHGLDEVWMKLVSQNGAVMAGLRVHIDNVVFESATRAAVQYTITAPGYSFTGRFGEAVLVDGTWKVTRSTICNDTGSIGSGTPCPA